MKLQLFITKYKKGLYYLFVKYSDFVRIKELIFIYARHSPKVRTKNLHIPIVTKNTVNLCIKESKTKNLTKHYLVYIYAKSTDKHAIN